MTNTVIWYWRGARCGFLANPYDSMSPDKQIGIAVLATCCRLDERLPKGGLSAFAAGYKDALHRQQERTSISTESILAEAFDQE